MSAAVGFSSLNSDAAPLPQPRLAGQAIAAQDMAPRGTELDAFCAAALLLGKDISAIARLCSKQVVEVAGMWEQGRGTQLHQACRAMSQQQRQQLMGHVMDHLQQHTTEPAGKVDGSVQATLLSLRQQVDACQLTVADAVDQLVFLLGAPRLLHAVQQVVRAWVPGARELAQQHMQGCGEAAADASDEEMCDPNLATPLDSHTGGDSSQGQLGSADAAVSLALRGQHLGDMGLEQAEHALLPTKLLPAMQQPPPKHATPAQPPPQQLQPRRSVPHAVNAPAGAAASTAAASSGGGAVAAGGVEPRSHSTPPTPATSRRSSRPATPTRQHHAAEQTPTKVCTNCGTTTTPLWRKEGGVLMCNACGIYFKTHGFHRPVDLIRAASQARGRGSSGGGAPTSNGGATSSAGHPPHHHQAGGGTPGGTPAVSADFHAGGSIGGTTLTSGFASQHAQQGDTATSPPHRRRRSSPSPLRWRHSVGEPASSGGGGGGGAGRVRRPSATGSLGAPPSDLDADDGLSDGGQSTGGASVRRSGRRRTSQQALGPSGFEWYDAEDLAPASRRNSNGGGGGSSGGGGHPHQGKRSRFAEHLQGVVGGAPGGVFHSAPGSECGDEPEGGGFTSGMRSRLGEGRQLGLEMGPTLSGPAHLPASSDSAAAGATTGGERPAGAIMGREFSFGSGTKVFLDMNAGPDAQHACLPAGLHPCTTPRLPSGPGGPPMEGAAADPNNPAAAAGTAKGEHSGSADGTRASGPSYDGWVASKREGGAAAAGAAPAGAAAGGAPLVQPLVGEGSMEVEDDASDLTVAHDPAQVAAVLLGLKHALVLNDGGPSSYKGSGRNSPWASSPARRRTSHDGDDRHGAGPSYEHGYWSGPDEIGGGGGGGGSSGGGSAPAGRHTKRSRSPMSRAQKEAARAAAGGGAGADGSGKPATVCANCGTSKTPLWRKDKETGESMCNACGIYKQTHGYARPYRTSQRDPSPGRAASAGAADAGAVAGAANGGSGATSAVAMPISAGRKPNKPSLSVQPVSGVAGAGAAAGGTSPGSAAFVGTPPGTSSAGAGVLHGPAPPSSHQRRASTGYTPGGKPPLPPPTLPRMVGAGPVAAHVQLVPHQNPPALGLPASGMAVDHPTFTPFAVQQQQAGGEGGVTGVGLGSTSSSSSGGAAPAPGSAPAMGHAQAMGMPSASWPAGSTMMAGAPAGVMGGAAPWPFYTFSIPQQQQQQAVQQQGQLQEARSSPGAPSGPEGGMSASQQQQAGAQEEVLQPRRSSASNVGGGSQAKPGGAGSQQQAAPVAHQQVGPRPGMGPTMIQGFGGLPSMMVPPPMAYHQPGPGQQPHQQHQQQQQQQPVHLGLSALRGTAGQGQQQHAPQGQAPGPQQQQQQQQPLRQIPVPPPPALGVPQDPSQAFAAAASLSRVLQAHQMAAAAAAAAHAAPAGSQGSGPAAGAESAAGHVRPPPPQPQPQGQHGPHAAQGAPAHHLPQHAQHMHGPMVPAAGFPMRGQPGPTLLQALPPGVMPVFTSLFSVPHQQQPHAGGAGGPTIMQAAPGQGAAGMLPPGAAGMYHLVPAPFAAAAGQPVPPQLHNSQM